MTSIQAPVVSRTGYILTSYLRAFVVNALLHFREAALAEVLLW